jgi:HlyD family secretion protein
MRIKILTIATILFFVSCGNGKETFDASGVFEATEVIVSSEANGKILSLNIQEGQDIEIGNEYGLIDTLQLYLKRQQLLYGIEAMGGKSIDVNTQIAALEEQIRKLKIEKQRIETLLQKKAANTKQLDDINSNIAVLEMQLNAQKTSFEKGNKSIGSEESSLRVQVLQLNDQLNKCKITTPINGTVLLKYSEEGEITAIGRPLFKVADMNNMILRVYVTSSQLTQIMIGQEVKVFADFGDKRKEYKGNISWISSKAEFTPKAVQVKDDRDNLVYAIKVSVKNDGYLKIGMYADINL